MNLKKLIRQKFRDAVFDRDKHMCKFCKNNVQLDAHHITDRSMMPNGGYVATNGITLCQLHHKLAELFHETGQAHPGFSPEDLYRLIESSYEKAYHDSMNLKQ